MFFLANPPLYLFLLPDLPTLYLLSCARHPHPSGFRRLILFVTANYLGDKIVICIHTDLSSNGHCLMGNLLGVHILPVQKSFSRRCK